MAIIKNTDHQEDDHVLLEVKIISATLKQRPHTHGRDPIKAYAAARIEFPKGQRTKKLCTQRCRPENYSDPKWDYELYFRVDPELLSDATLCVEVYTVGTIKDHCVGAVRCSVKDVIRHEFSTELALLTSSAKVCGTVNVDLAIQLGGYNPCIDPCKVALNLI